MCIIKNIMTEESNELRLAVIAGATSALEQLQKNKNMSHDDALRHVINNADEIIKNINFSN